MIPRSIRLVLGVRNVRSLFSSTSATLQSKRTCLIGRPSMVKEQSLSISGSSQYSKLMSVEINANNSKMRVCAIVRRVHGQYAYLLGLRRS